jgi:hypothetical protein
MIQEQKSTYILPAQVISGIEQTVVHVPRLTVKKLADKLVAIEKEKGYEVALLGVESLDYVEICHLCLEKHPDNDPHLMPSRFMILHGATDDGLKKKGNLDAFPYEHDGESHEMSVAELSRLLGILGWNQTTWMTEGDDEALLEEGEISRSERSDAHGLVGHLFGALCAYIDEAPPALGKESTGGTRKAAAGESLVGIAAELGIREWRLLWALNKDALGDDWANIPVGTELKLPDAEHNPLAQWFLENGWDDYLDPHKGYQYPGKYLRLSVFDDQKNALKLPDGTCEIYLTKGTHSLLHKLDLKDSKGLKVVVPDTPDLAVSLHGQDLPYRGVNWPSRGEFLARRDDPVSEEMA